jgi:hypothetical protein
VVRNGGASEDDDDFGLFVPQAVKGGIGFLKVSPCLFVDTFLISFANAVVAKQI